MMSIFFPCTAFTPTEAVHKSLQMTDSPIIGFNLGIASFYSVIFVDTYVVYEERWRAQLEGKLRLIFLSLLDGYYIAISGKLNITLHIFISF